MTKPINRFTSAFDDYICEGDTIAADFDGFTIHARIIPDDDAGRPDERMDGFWPSLDPNDPGFIGNVSKERFALELAQAEKVMTAWKNDEWFYCGVVLSIKRDGVTLDHYAASLWGIECNYPKHPKAASAPDDFPNTYLTEVANELLDDALAVGRTVLARLCVCQPLRGPATPAL